MNQKSLHRFHAKLRKIRPVYIVAPALVTTAVCAYSLRANNLEMVRLREALYRADESGQQVDIALNNLRSYVHSHMNTNLTTSEGIYPPIQLKYTYERLIKSQAPDSANAKIYQEAQAFCEQQNPTGFSGRGRVPCIEQYVAEHGATDSGDVDEIPSDMYKFDFVSPSWSPDLAGWSLLFAGFFWIVLLLRTGLGLVLRMFEH